MALLARHLYVGQEVHLDGLIAIAAAGLAASSFHVKREAPGFVAADFSFRQSHEERAYVGKDTRIGGRIRAWRAPQGRLVDVDHLIYIFQSFDGVVGHGVFQ